MFKFGPEFWSELCILFSGVMHTNSTTTILHAPKTLLQILLSRWKLFAIWQHCTRISWNMGTNSLISHSVLPNSKFYLLSLSRSFYRRFKIFHIFIFVHHRNPIQGHKPVRPHEINFLDVTNGGLFLGQWPNGINENFTDYIVAKAIQLMRENEKSPSMTAFERVCQKLKNQRV